MFKSNGVDQRIVDLNLRPAPLADTFSLSGRTQVNPVTVLTGRTLNIVPLGQSLNHNSVDGQGTFAHAAHIFNLSVAHRGAVFGAKEPLLTSHLVTAPTTGNPAGHHCMYLANDLIDDGVLDNALITSIATGNSTFAQWAANGDYSYRIGLAARCIANARLEGLPTILDMQLGESDALAGTSQATATTQMTSIIAECRRVGLLRPGRVLFIHKSTIVTGATTPNRNAIRAAIDAVVDGGLVRAGADIDTIGAGLRFDGTHMSTAGAQAQADLKAPFHTDFFQNG